MSVITSEVSGGTRKGPHGRREVYVSGTGWVPAAEAPPDALRPKASPASGEPVRRKPTERQQQVWDAVQRHSGNQQAAAHELGVTQGAISSGLSGYMANTGTKERPKRQEAHEDAHKITAPVSSPPSKRFDRRGEPPPPEHPFRAPLRAVAPDRAFNGGTTDPAEPQAKSNGRTPDLNVEAAPGEPAATLAEMRVLPARPVLPELPYPPEIPELPEIELVDDGDIQRAHCVGYASGYAVATLRILAAWPDGVPVSDAVRAMATDAADGLLA